MCWATGFVVRWGPLALATGLAAIWAWASPEPQVFASEKMQMVMLIDGANVELLWPEDRERGFWFRGCFRAGGARDCSVQEIASQKSCRRLYAIFRSHDPGTVGRWVNRYSMLPDGWLPVLDHNQNLYHERSIYFPIPTIIAALLLLSAPQFLTARRRHRPGLCKRCGYNLTGNVSGRCPECGTVIAETKA